MKTEVIQNNEMPLSFPALYENPSNKAVFIVTRLAGIYIHVCVLSGISNYEIGHTYTQSVIATGLQRLNPGSKIILTQE